MLKKRITTALILLPVVLCGFFLLEGSSFALFIGLFVTLGAWEWARLAGLEAQRSCVAFAAIVALLLYGLYIFPDLALWVLAAAIFWWATATYLVLTFPQSAECWSAKVTKLFIGLFILLPAWQGLVLMKAMPLNNRLIMAVMVLIWSADIGAYFFGRKFGKHKLVPRVSPGKSWEGVFGGLLLGLLITSGVGFVRDWSASEMFIALGSSAVIVLISVVGDLTESMFKRQSGVKDSSSLLPGHGGVLDRIDSLTAAIPVFAVFLWIVAQ